MDRKIVLDWYENQNHIEEMIHWNKGKLKHWEEEVIQFFPAGASVLDIGCGLGREAFALYDKGFAVTGIDISKSILQEVKQLASINHYNLSFLHYDGKNLPFSENSFDVAIIWAQTFGLLYGEEYKHQLLLECKRVLKERGLLSYSGHDYNFVTKYYKQFMEGRKFYAYADTDLYWETFTPQELVEPATKAGFDVIECKEGEIYHPENGVVLYCVCRKGNE